MEVRLLSRVDEKSYTFIDHSASHTRTQTRFNDVTTSRAHKLLTCFNFQLSASKLKNVT